MTDDTALLTALRSVVGPSQVLTDPDAVAGFCVDWTGGHRGSAIAVVRPGSTDEVAAVVSACAAHGAGITPQGGNTGLVGGGIPHGTVVLSTGRLNAVGDVDPVAMTVGVGAGATLHAVDAAAAAVGLTVGVDLASRESATIGGMAATNAGGIRFLRHGGMRSHVAGVTAVLPDGRVLRRWLGLAKDNVGYDLPGLLCGSEGTLAVITEVLVRLVPKVSGGVAVALVEVASAEQAVTVARGCASAGFVLEAAELVLRDGMDMVFAQHPELAGAVSGDASAAALIEVSDARLSGVEVAETLAESLAGLDVNDASIEPHPASRLWAVRERHTESAARSSTTPVVKLDITVPLPRLDDAAALARQVAAEFDCRAVVFGHFLDGNLHLNFLDAKPDRSHELSEFALRGIAALGGSISAEHGIGVAKRDWITLGRSDVDLASMRAIKAAWDPSGLLNPGVLF